MKRIGPRAALAVATVAVLCAASAAVASVLSASSASGGQITFVNVTRQDLAATTSSTTYVKVPGSGTRVTVTDGSDLILARFSAESACYHATPSTIGNWCSVRLVLYDQATGLPVAELFPQSGVDFAFDSTDAGTEGSASWESHSMDRSIRVGNGAYNVKVEWAVTSSNVVFRLDDWSLTVEKAT